MSSRLPKDGACERKDRIDETQNEKNKKDKQCPYFSIINFHLVDINMFAKFYEILSLPFQDIEKSKRCGRTD